MSADRSHLIPTTVVDKNGVQTVRHMKPADSRTASASIPPASVAATAVDYAKCVTEALGYRGEHWGHQCIKVLQDEDETTLQFVYQKITTGSEFAQTTALGAFRRTLGRMPLAQVKSEENWRVDNYLTEREIKTFVAIAWGVGHVVEATGSEVNPIDIASRVNMTHGLMTYRDETDRSEDDAYWHALAIVGIYDPMTTKGLKEELHEFVPWAAAHPDPARIVTLLRERGTYNVATLRELEDERNEINPSLREGTL